jgi:glycosyltransferase involved in cell wall biosynthesis
VEPISKIADSFIWLQLQNDHLNHNTYRSEIIYALCHKVLVNSTYIKNRVLTIKNAKPENISVHRNCTDISMFDKNRFSADVILKIKKRFGINDGEVVILYCGRIVSEKGIRELIMAVRKLPRNLKIKLLIVGSKNFDKKVFNFFLHSLKKLSKEISDKIVFTGFIPYKELPEVYAVSDIAVVPSIWEEPAGRVIIEAQASGLPLIASGSGGMLDYICKDSTIVVKRGKNFIDNLSFEINRLVNDSVLRNTMGRAGYEFAKNFDSHKYYEQLIKLLRRDNR